MFPFNFEWIWDASHLIFMGGLWYALRILGAGMTFIVIKTIIDTAQGKGGHQLMVNANFSKFIDDNSDPLVVFFRENPIQ